MKVYSIFLSAICLLPLTTLLTAQSQLGAGAVSGTIEDTGGGAVPGAVITITNQATSLTRTVTTTDSGQFNFPVLQPDTYIVTVEKQGFSRIEQRDVQVTVGRTVTLQLALQPGEVSAVVTIEGAPIIDITKTDESSLISREQINELPINGRRADQFALLTPGVTREGRFGLLSYRGQSGNFNNYTLEGNDDNNSYFAEPRGRTRTTFNLSANAIQEFQVTQSNFLPEFGRSAGGGINATLRSGTNRFSGDAFEYFRNKSLTARDPLSSFRPEERRHQFGGSFSGPVVRDRLFFFVNYEQQFRNFPLVTEDLSGVLTGGAPVLPANATAAQIAAFNANTTAFNRGVADLRARFPGGAPGNSLPRTQNIANLTGKIDWSINKSNTFTGSYNYFNLQAENAIQTPLVLGNVGRNGSDEIRINASNFRLTSVLSSKAVNEARFLVSREFAYQFGNEPPPQVFVGGFSFGRATFLERPALPDERKYQLVDNFSYTIGQHSLKFGGDFIYSRDKINNPANFGGSFSYANALQYGLDLIARDGGVIARNYSNNGFQQSFGIPGLTFSTKDYAVYAQDQWRVLKNFTINYGVRYDYLQLPDPLAPNPVIPETQQINEDKSSVGPRFGIAYDIAGDGKTVVRGGYGLYYGRTPSGLIFNALTQTGLRVGGGLTGAPDLTRTVASISLSPTTAVNGVIIAPVFPNTFAAFPNVNVPLTVFRLDPNYKNSRLQEFNIAIEREIISNLTVSASFVYTKGDRLPVTFDTNLPEPTFSRTYQLPDGSTISTPFAAAVTCRVAVSPCPTAQTVGTEASRLNPAFGATVLQRSIGETYYRALFVEVKRRFSTNYQFGIAYTLAKAENLSGTGNGAGEGLEGAFSGSSLFNQFNLQDNRAAAPTDQRHRFVLNGIYNVPFFRGNSRIIRALANGYRISGVYTAESGRPFAATIAFPNVSFVQDGARFSPFGGGTLGLGGSSLAPDVERNSDYGDANYRLDLRIARDIKISERAAIELIAEGFNLFNRSNFNGFNGVLYDAVNPGLNAAADTPIVLTRRANFGTPNNNGSPPDGTNARRFQIAARFRF